ncbi:MAG: hypothetical protein EA377_00990 [Phycisphaerales bacterium]|nr:MAG: hypothetical protein EA377_00990 [Phycisphaerales bacterium]
MPFCRAVWGGLFERRIAQPGALTSGLLGLALLVSTGTSSALAQAGLDELIERLGEENVPTGEDVIVGMVESPANNNYLPNASNPELQGVTILPMSGSSGSSGHATTVARNFFGSEISLSPGIPTAHVWETNNWLQAGGLRVGQGIGAPPLTPPAGMRILNNSWIGDADNFNNEIIRRADFLAQRDNVFFSIGINNSNNQLPLLSHMYNGLSVGILSGNHATGDTIGGIDGAGRMKPEIVAPGNLTSWAAPLVGGAAALMIETAETDPVLSGNITDATRIDVLRAVILAGADHFDGWTNNPETSGPQRGVTDRPLDEVFGAGALNVDRSHRILTGDVVAGDTQSLPATAAGHAGWGLATMNAGQSRYWRFDVPEFAEEVSIISTWTRTFGANYNLPQTQNVNLQLWRVDDAGQLTTLIGPAGEPYFAGGNVASQSTLNNVEHLYITGLEPGEYVLEANRADAFSGQRTVALAWLFPEPPKTDPGVIGDLNGDGVVNVFDLLLLLEGWGPCPSGSDCPADLNGDGTVNVFDLLLLLENWG